MTDYAQMFRERYSTSLLADSAFRTGAALGLPAPGLQPLDRTSKLAGPAVTVEARTDLVSILEGVHHAEPGDVVVIVVDGLVRDTAELIAMGLPVFCRGSFPAGPLKVSSDRKGIGEVGVDVSVGGATVRPGMWVFGDADGVIFVDERTLDAVFEAAEAARQQEEALAREIASGMALGDAFDLDAFLEERRTDPDADFNDHLAKVDRAI